MCRRRLVVFTLMSTLMWVAPSAWAQCLVPTPPLPAGTGKGNALYVDPNGRDSGACPSSAPCRTIKYALAQMRDGDALHVRPGTYDEYLNGNEPRFPNSVLIAAVRRGTVTLGGFELGGASYVVIDGLITHGFHFGDGGSHNRIQNTEVNDGGVFGSAPYTELINLNVHDVAVGPNGASLCAEGPGLCHGVYSSADHLLIEGGEYHHNEGWGLHLRLGPTNQTVRHVCSHHNGGAGIGFIGGGGNTAYENTVWDNEVGFWVSAGNTIYDNIVYGNRSVDILADPGTTVYDNVDNRGNPVLPNQ